MHAFYSRFRMRLRAWLWTPALLSLLLLVLVLPALGRPTAARADTLSVSVDLPAALTFANGAPTERVTGLVVDVALPILLGGGFTRFTGWSGPNHVDYTTVHALFDLPVFFIKLRAGLGAGQAKPVFPGAANQYKAAPVNELYVRGGLALFPGLDLHVGFHSLQGETESTAPVPSTLDLSVTVYTVGLTMGF